MNKKIICAGCGTQFPDADSAPESCLICSDDRQYIPDGVQVWTTHDELKKNHRVAICEIDKNLFELKMTPSFAIGQRAFLLLTPGGNILWDCVPLLDESTSEFIQSKGGIQSIAISHPHFYSTMTDWADVFDCPVYIHDSDKVWIAVKSDSLVPWNGLEMALWDGIKIINIGGHFSGSSILRIPFLSNAGTILCGDTFVISPGKTHIAAMHSYPNKIPLPVSEIKRIRKRMRDLEFDTIHAWIDSQSIQGDAKSILEESLAKYV